ncbi:hypothetical protein KIN20_011951 [Parelaphostrongylus tenuis]|uniref:Uncharacterized protein n=1 Tax=Parelaphostrongylus tenuis TaxID=148309 RepID=A0AAD5MW58_PARTN|nr:hypothetical protein KIN20_011951 [Parelaphostrongylus tenuis]
MLLGTSRNLVSKTNAVRSENVSKKKAITAVYGCGLSASGALAIPELVVNDKFVTAREAYKPRRINHLNVRGIKYIAAGFGFSLFASKDKLFGSGLNNRFQITSHVQDTARKPQDYYISLKRIQLPSQTTILSVSSGRAHSLIATTAGVFAFGDNAYGQCGQNPEKYREVYGLSDTPLPSVKIPSDSPAVAVHCSLDTSFILTQEGEVFSFGLNEDGQCASGTYDNQWMPAKITGDTANEKVISISGSSDTMLALSEKGEIFIWGQNEYGQAGLGIHDIQLNSSRHIPFPAGKISSAASTMSSCMVSTENGEVYVWGVVCLVSVQLCKNWIGQY